MWEVTMIDLSRVQRAMVRHLENNGFLVNDIVFDGSFHDCDYISNGTVIKNGGKYRVYLECSSPVISAVSTTFKKEIKWFYEIGEAEKSSLYFIENVIGLASFSDGFTNLNYSRDLFNYYYIQQEILNFTRSLNFDHAYLKQKNLPIMGDLFLADKCWKVNNTIFNVGDLIIPITSIDANTQKLLYVNYLKVNKNGKKRFRTSFVNNGGFHLISSSNNISDRVVFTTSYSTGVSLNLALNCPVVVCFSVLNLSHAYQSLKPFLYGSDAIFALDNDIYSLENISLALGLIEAVKSNVKFVIPIFDQCESKGRDYCDLYSQINTVGVRQQIDDQLNTFKKSNIKYVALDFFNKYLVSQIVN